MVIFHSYVSLPEGMGPEKNTNIYFPSEKDHNQWIWGHTIVRQTNM